MGRGLRPYPTKTIKIILPFAPGNSPDIVARLIAPPMTARLGQPVIVENRPGAGGSIGATAAVSSRPDGYTIGAVQIGNLRVLPRTSKNLPYDALKDFTPIGHFDYHYLVSHRH